MKFLKYLACATNFLLVISSLNAQGLDLSTDDPLLFVGSTGTINYTATNNTGNKLLLSAVNAPIAQNMDFIVSDHCGGTLLSSGESCHFTIKYQALYKHTGAKTNVSITGFHVDDGVNLESNSIMTTIYSSPVSFEGPSNTKIITYSGSVVYTLKNETAIPVNLQITDFPSDYRIFLSRLDHDNCLRNSGSHKTFKMPEFTSCKIVFKFEVFSVDDMGFIDEIVNIAAKDMPLSTLLVLPMKVSLVVPL